MFRACELKDQTYKKTRTLHVSECLCLLQLFAPPSKSPTTNISLSSDVLFWIAPPSPKGQGLGGNKGPLRLRLPQLLSSCAASS